MILIGIIALIVLGPRKLPEIARKIGKIMADFRTTTNEFKETWEREVNFEEEAKALRIDDLDETPVPRILPSTSGSLTEGMSAPEIKEIDAGAFDKFDSAGDTEASTNGKSDDSPSTQAPDHSLSEKKNWL